MMPLIPLLGKTGEVAYRDRFGVATEGSILLKNVTVSRPDVF